MKRIKLKPIEEVSKKIGISDDNLYHYGKYVAKIDPAIYNPKDQKRGKLLLVTAMTPTKTGEGKTFTTVSLLDSLNSIGVPTIGCLREPSLGPVFGLKGGAVGGGEETIEPAEDINLHFTGDMHALTSSINLISACIDNHIHQGNELHIDPEQIVWKRALDMNDRELREVKIGQGSSANGVKRTDSFQITVASELMAILAIASSAEDFRERISNILVAYTYDHKPIYLKDLRITNAVMKLMKYALWPNLVQSREGNPCFVHAGPFANIAHGCSSVIATKMALQLAADLNGVVVTEAGFGADLGAEKFLDIKCQEAKLFPDGAVLVATIKALKLHGGVEFEKLVEPNADAIATGYKNLKRHYDNLRKYGLNCIVAINRFDTDGDEEVEFLKKLLAADHIEYAVFNTFSRGSIGALDLAKKVKQMLDGPSGYRPIYEKGDYLLDKINNVVTKIYNGKTELEDVHKYVKFSGNVEERLKTIADDPIYANYYVCFAKTQSSFTDDPTQLNAPDDFKITIRDFSISNGARFIVLYTGSIMTMPGLPKVPRAVMMEDEEE